jgi:hypothetical protein
MLNFIQEFNDEKSFHLLLSRKLFWYFFAFSTFSATPMDKELFKTTKDFFVPELILPDNEETNEETNDQDIDIRIIPITKPEPITEPTTTQSTTQSTTKAPETTTR